jgi:hypothetical protein
MLRIRRYLTKRDYATETPGLRDAIASALLRDLHANGAPNTLRAWTQRQMLMTQAIARVLGKDFATLSPMVKTQWHKVYGLPPMSSDEQDFLRAAMAEARSLQYVPEIFGGIAG